MRIAEDIGDGPMADKAQHLSQDVLLAIVQKTLDIILDAVARGETVELRNFGVFEVKVRKARIGRNPNSPTADVPIPPRAVVKFKPGKEMREQGSSSLPTRHPRPRLSADPWSHGHASSSARRFRGRNDNPETLEPICKPAESHLSVGAACDSPKCSTAGLSHLGQESSG